MVNKTLRVVHNGDVDGRLVIRINGTENDKVKFFFQVKHVIRVHSRYSDCEASKSILLFLALLSHFSLPRGFLRFSLSQPLPQPPPEVEIFPKLFISLVTILPF